VRLTANAGGDPIPDDLGAVLLPGNPSADVPGGRQIATFQLATAAGSGADSIGEVVAGAVSFRRDWLERQGLDASRCVVVAVRAESMEPTLPDGCSILVDPAGRRRREGGVYVLRTDDGIVVKRLGRTNSGWTLVSDHPSWPDAIWPKGAEIIGRVRWMARTL